MPTSWIVLLIPVAMFLFLLSIPILETLVTHRQRCGCPALRAGGTSTSRWP
jgi:hypothetical protein